MQAGRRAAIRVVAMPADTNPYGDIFGGWLMSQMDLAAGLVAARHSGGRSVTVAAEAMSFHHPVFVGDEVTVYAALRKAGRTSMKIAVSAWRRAREAEEVMMVTSADFTFVAINRHRQPRLLPGNAQQ